MAIWLCQLIPMAPLLSYFLLRFVDGPSLGRIVMPVAILLFSYCLFVLAMAIVPAGRRWIYRHRRQLILAATSGFCAYILCEIAALSLWTENVWLYENSQATVHFDPILGYKLEATPSRCACITNGIVECVGVLRGNNLGFPDRDDFHPGKSDARTKRIAVFGDSFTAAPYLSPNWPEVVEDLTRSSADPLDLLNFSLEGIGLANWWSIITRIVETENYQIDGAVFAIYGDDLRRGFTVAEHRGYDHAMLWRVPSWDPRRFPSTRAEAELHLRELSNGYIVSTDEFETALQRRSGRRFPPLARAGYYCFRRAVKRPILHFRQNENFESGVAESARKVLVADIRRSLSSMGVPALVVSVPFQSQLLAKGDQIVIAADTREFASLIGAECVNGGLAFQGLTKTEIREHWLPYDGHWGQKGSDRFGQFMTEVLQKWPGKGHARANTTPETRE
jgi:hypothetical protein